MNLAPEKLLKLAVNLVMADWKEQWPELEAYEPPSGPAVPAGATRH